MITKNGKDEVSSEICNSVLRKLRKNPTLSKRRLKRELNLKEKQVLEALAFLQKVGVIRYGKGWKNDEWRINRDFDDSDD